MIKKGQGGLDLESDKKRALALTPVSRETLERLEVFVDLLLLWQEKINLVAESTLPLVWTRHISDSLQLLALAGAAKVWVDLGSGAGFPGVVIACALAGTPEVMVHLIESNVKKANFLREVVRAIGIPAHVHLERAEKFGESCAEAVEVVTARALSPLKTLCDQVLPFIQRGAIGLFPKGQDVATELTEAAKYWSIQASFVPSVTSPAGSIVIVRGLQRLKKS